MILTLPALTRVALAGLLSALSLTAALPALAAVDAQTTTAAAVTDRLIIKYRNGTAAALRPDFATMAAAHDSANRLGVQMSRMRGNALSAHVMKLDRVLSRADAHTLAQAIARADANIEYAEPDLILQKQLAPNDTSWLSQWSLYEPTAGINAEAAWTSTTGTGVVVAVVDTGYRPHADLAANIVGGHDFISTAAVGNDGDGRDASALDPGDGNAAGACGTGSAASYNSWHGTHVAGTIAALTNNATGVAGIAHGAKVLPVRVLGKCGGYTSDIADGVIWASGGSVAGVPANANPARVINLSLGGSGTCGTTMQAAVNTARGRGAVIVVAAGNSNASANSATPANCHGVTTVASVGRTGARAYYSNTGTVVDVAAPGGDTRAGYTGGILSTLNTGSNMIGTDSYAWYQGTSMATPHVAGVAALIISRNPSLTVEQVEALLRSSVRPFVATCSGCGTGMLDAGLAVTAAAAAPAVVTTALADVEPNSTLAAAQTVAASVARVSGNIATSGDLDLYKVTVPNGKTLTALLTPAATTDLNLTLYTSGGSALVSSSNSGLGAQDRVVYSNNSGAAVTYIVGVRYGSGGVGSTRGTYQLNLAQ